jgi:hypothetical protein
MWKEKNVTERNFSFTPVFADQRGKKGNAMLVEVFEAYCRHCRQSELRTQIHMDRLATSGTREEE